MSLRNENLLTVLNTTMPSTLIRSSPNRVDHHHLYQDLCRNSGVWRKCCTMLYSALLHTLQSNVRNAPIYCEILIEIFCLFFSPLFHSLLVKSMDISVYINVVDTTGQRTRRDCQG